MMHMTIERKIDANGAVTYIVKVTTEESKAIDEAHTIIAERYKQLGIEQTAWDKEHLEYALQGRLRFDGVEAMLNWAKTVTIIEKKNNPPRGYC